MGEDARRLPLLRLVPNLVTILGLCVGLSFVILLLEKSLPVVLIPSTVWRWIVAGHIFL
jgi:phosphatidylserine synthase